MKLRTSISSSIAPCLPGSLPPKSFNLEGGGNSQFSAELEHKTQNSLSQSPYHILLAIVIAFRLFIMASCNVNMPQIRIIQVRGLT